MSFQLCGQSVQDAIKQLKGRNAKNRLFRFEQGVLASFAVDTLSCLMASWTDWPLGLNLSSIANKANPSGQSVQDAIKQLKGRNAKNRIYS